MDDNEGGVRCPKCHSRFVPVRNTIHTTMRWRGNKRDITKRYRVCQHCHTVFHSVEVTMDKEIKEDLNQGITEPPTDNPFIN